MCRGRGRVPAAYNHCSMAHQRKVRFKHDVLEGLVSTTLLGTHSSLKKLRGDRHLIVAGVVCLLFSAGACLCGSWCGSRTERKKQLDAMPDVEQPKESSQAPSRGSPAAETTVAHSREKGRMAAAARDVHSPPAIGTASSTQSRHRLLDLDKLVSAHNRGGPAIRGSTPPRDRERGPSAKLTRAPPPLPKDSGTARGSPSSGHRP